MKLYHLKCINKIEDDIKLSKKFNDNLRMKIKELDKEIKLSNSTIKNFYKEFSSNEPMSFGRK